MDKIYYHRANIRKKGSALITSVLFVFVAALLSGSFLKLAYNEYKASVRSYLYSSAFNLAESGIELAIAALNDKRVSGSTWTESYNNYLTDGGYIGDIDVVILNASSANPTIYSEGIIAGHPSGDVVKQIKLELSSGSALADPGLAAGVSIDLGGQTVADSYDPDFGHYGAELAGTTAPSDYGIIEDGVWVNKNDNAKIASGSKVTTEGETVLDQGNAIIYGELQVKEGTEVSIGPKGKVTSYEENRHDDSRVSYDFYADYPVVQSASTDFTISSITSTQTITTGNYTVDSISMSGNSSKVVTISGDVVLVVTGNISFTGSSSINVTSGSTLTIYAEGDVSIGGNGIVNTDLHPSDVVIYGTQDSTVDSNGDYIAGQDIDISGNGQLAATVYAPGADLKLNGGGTRGAVYGTAVALNIKLTGGSTFHTAENSDISQDDTYSVDSWLEMTGTTEESTPIDMLQYTTVYPNS